MLEEMMLSSNEIAEIELESKRSGVSVNGVIVSIVNSGCDVKEWCYEQYVRGEMGV